MTTPERLRRRQRRESAGIALLAVLLVAAFIYFQGQADAQKRCLTNYITANSATSQIRSELVERESKATRNLLLNGTAAQSREEFQAARQAYVRAIKQIDKARRENPVRPFPEGVCD